jgi:hypothetical protein
VGILDDFYFDSEGQLDRLILQKVLRRPLSSDKPVDQSAASQGNERFYPIDGDNFVLRYSEAITLNVQYVKFTDPSSGRRPPIRRSSSTGVVHRAASNPQH